jgi:hypothetical protein
MDNIDKALAEFAKMPNQKQMEMILSMHNQTPQVTKDNWLSDVLNQSNELFRNDVSEYVLTNAPTEAYNAVAGTIIRSLKNANEHQLTSDVLLQIYRQEVAAPAPAASSQSASASASASRSSFNNLLLTQQVTAPAQQVTAPAQPVTAAGASEGQCAFADASSGAAASGAATSVSSSTSTSSSLSLPDSNNLFPPTPPHPPPPAKKQKNDGSPTLEDKDEEYSWSFSGINGCNSQKTTTPTKSGNYGATPLRTKIDTADLFDGDTGNFIVLVTKEDNKIGFNMGYAIRSIFNYTKVEYTKAKLGREVNIDPFTITSGNMIALLNQYNVQHEEIKTTTEVNIYTGVEYLGKLILLVFDVSRYDEEENPADFPPTWKHFSLFFQENKVLLTLNQQNINYKLGSIVGKKGTAAGALYARNALHKKICPVIRAIPDKYPVQRKMNLCSAYIIHEN